MTFSPKRSEMESYQTWGFSPRIVQNEIMTSRHFISRQTGHFNFQNFQKSQPEDPNPVRIVNIELIINLKKAKIFSKKNLHKRRF